MTEIKARVPKVSVIDAPKLTATKIMKCPNCEKSRVSARYQDAEYGKYRRVMNRKQGKMLGWNCTICGMSIGGSD